MCSKNAHLASQIWQHKMYIASADVLWNICINSDLQYKCLYTKYKMSAACVKRAQQYMYNLKVPSILLVRTRTRATVKGHGVGKCGPTRGVRERNKKCITAGHAHWPSIFHAPFGRYFSSRLRGSFPGSFEKFSRIFWGIFQGLLFTLKNILTCSALGQH